MQVEETLYVRMDEVFSSLWPTTPIGEIRNVEGEMTFLPSESFSFPLPCLKRIVTLMENMHGRSEAQ